MNKDSIWLGVTICAFIASFSLTTIDYARKDTSKKRTAILFLTLTVLLFSFVASLLDKQSTSSSFSKIIDQNKDLSITVSKIADSIDSQFEDQVNARSDVFFSDDIFLVELQVRKQGEHSWRRSIDAEIGDVLEFQAMYVNKTSETANDIMARVILPNNLSYIENSTVLYNSNYQEGARVIENTLCDSGINIGNYYPRGNAYIRFSATVQDNTLEEGSNELINWITVTSSGKVLYDSSSIYVAK